LLERFFRKGLIFAKVWKSLFARSSFLNIIHFRCYQKLYHAEQSEITLHYFFRPRFFIAFAGLFGLATVNTYTTIKEIGIRKVLGASVSNIPFAFKGDLSA